MKTAHSSDAQLHYQGSRCQPGSTRPGANLADVFYGSAERSPDAIALRIKSRDWTYGELRHLANSLIDAIGSIGDEAAHIGVVLTRDAFTYAAMLAVMRAGHTYVPLNPKIGVHSARSLVCRSELAAVVFNPDAAEFIEQIGDGNLRLITRADTGHRRAHIKLSTADIAYILFTSGSTGHPKGVPVYHSSVLNMLANVQDELSIQPNDRCTQFAELSFDFSIGEIFLTWAAGACLIVPDASDIFDLADFVRRNEITVWSSVPTLASLVWATGGLSSEGFKTVRIGYFCGEAFQTELARAWAQACPSARLFNIYGPTEVAVFATCHKIEEADLANRGSIPIGKALKGVFTRILPEGGDYRKGELILGGQQVFPGYLNSPELNAAALSSDEKGIRWYHTGDIISIDDEGIMKFEGRMDREVKIRGYRVNLDDTEYRLREIEGILDVAVTATGDNGLLSDIAIFYVGNVSSDEASFLFSVVLPSYLKPSFIYQLAQFPVNTNGKVAYGDLKNLALSNSQV